RVCRRRRRRAAGETSERLPARGDRQALTRRADVRSLVDGHECGDSATSAGIRSPHSWAVPRTRGPMRRGWSAADAEGVGAVAVPVTDEHLLALAAVVLLDLLLRGRQRVGHEERDPTTDGE